MEGKVMAAIGGCAVLAGVTYILQGGMKSRDNMNQHLGVPGLVNLGNTCYLNCVLQALASVSVFVSWIKTRDEENKTEQRLGKLTSELNKFMQILNEPCYGQESHDPTMIFKALYSHGWVITLEQQDAHEIFQVLTSTLAEEQEDASHKTWKSILSDQDEMSVDDESIVLRSGVTASKVERKSWSPFLGLFANQLSCKTCSHKYPVKFDSFNTVSLSLSSNFQLGVITLQSLIGDFMCSEVLETSQCSECGQKNHENHKTRLLKKLSLGKLPQCLCFHINRTYWNNNGMPYKNNACVTFPESLNIEPYLYSKANIGNPIRTFGLCSNNIATKENSTTSRKREKLNTVYSLAAVVIHLGGVQSGHYVTHRKIEETWYLISDETTRTVPLSTVLKSNPYMLFYERIVLP